MLEKILPPNKIFRDNFRYSLHSSSKWTLSHPCRSKTWDDYAFECQKKPAGGRGASVSACADLTNQLQCCWVDPAYVLGKNTDTGIVGYQWTGVGGHHALYC